MAHLLTLWCAVTCAEQRTATAQARATVAATPVRLAASATQTGTVAAHDVRLAVAVATHPALQPVYHVVTAEQTITLS